MELLLHTLKQLDEENERKLQAGEINENDDNNNIPVEYKETRLGQNEERFQKYNEILQQLVIDTKKNVSDRIEYLIEETDEEAKRYASLWELRETYRLDIEKKNQSLAFLLNKTKEAIQTCREIDNPTLDNKKKKK